MCVCVCACVRVCVCVCVYVCDCMRVLVVVGVCVCVCLFVCVYVGVYVWVGVCVFVYVCVDGMRPSRLHKLQTLFRVTLSCTSETECKLQFANHEACYEYYISPSGTTLQQKS